MHIQHRNSGLVTTDVGCVFFREHWPVRVRIFMRNAACRSCVGDKCARPFSYRASRAHHLFNRIKWTERIAWPLYTLIRLEKVSLKFDWIKHTRICAYLIACENAIGLVKTNVQTRIDTIWYTSQKSVDVPRRKRSVSAFVANHASCCFFFFSLIYNTTHMGYVMGWGISAVRCIFFSLYQLDIGDNQFKTNRRVGINSGNG